VGDLPKHVYVRFHPVGQKVHFPVIAAHRSEDVVLDEQLEVVLGRLVIEV
jgi:hypothetical protein